MKNRYKAYRIVDGKLRWIVIDENGIIINRNPGRNELKVLEKEIRYDQDTRKKKLEYKEGDICPICTEDNEITERSILHPGRSFREHDKDGNETGRYICNKCYEKYDPNSTNNAIKSVRNCRTGNQNKGHECTKGDIDIRIACEIYGYINLNKKNNNYSRGTPVDCYNPKTGLFHQIEGRFLKSIKTYIITRRRYIYYDVWPTFGDYGNEWDKEYKDMICFCKSKDGNRIERIYRFPFSEIIGRTFKIIKNPIRRIPWYEKYRITDEEELKRANEILENICF
jgi:hypothetical protein